MATVILFSPAATADLHDIWNYTVAKWGENKAELYLKELSLDCNKLCEGLIQGITIDYVRLGYRKVLAGKHAIYFTRQENEIVIVRILHQRMDVDEVL